MSRVVSWSLLVVWSAWLFALQGLLASGQAGQELTAWTPDLGICLLLALDPRLERSDALLAVCIVAGARAAFSSDPAVAVLVGYAALVVSTRRLRRGFEIDHALPRALFAAVFGALLTTYWSLARSVALAASGITVAQETVSSGRVGRAAVATALCAAVLGPLLVRLPGMSPLRRRSS